MTWTRGVIFGISVSLIVWGGFGLLTKGVKDGDQSLVCDSGRGMEIKMENASISHKDGLYYITTEEGQKATYDKSLIEKCVVLATKDYQDAGKP